MQYLHTLLRPFRLGLEALPPPGSARNSRWEELRPRPGIPLPPPPEDRDDPADHEAPRDDDVVILLL